MRQINNSQKTPLSQNGKSEPSVTEPLAPQIILPPSDPLSKPMLSVRSNRTLKMLVSITTILVSMAAVAGAVYLISGFVIAQLEAQQTLKYRQKVEPAQQKIDERRRKKTSVNGASQEEDTLGEASAKVQLNRAERLAAIDQFKAAIDEANKISSSSSFYQQAQQSISQWSEQLLQQDAEQRNMQQQLQAEHERNQRHLQLAQQALTQNDWSTALQEAKQISRDPLWQQQRDDIFQKAEPFETEQKAKQFLDLGESENAISEANKLPLIAPWREKRSIIIEQANQRTADKKIAEKWNDRCREWAKDNISRCPNVEDMKNFEEILPTNWLSKFIHSSHQPKR